MVSGRLFVRSTYEKNGYLPSFPLGLEQEYRGDYDGETMNCPWCGEPEFLGYHGRPEEIEFLCGGLIIPKINKFFPSLKCEKAQIEKAVTIIREALDHQGDGITVYTIGGD